MSSSLEVGDHAIMATLWVYYLPHFRFPYTPPTITLPSSYAMQTLVPSGDQRMSFTKEALRLLTIYSTQAPLYFMKTMMVPVESQVVSFLYF